MTQTASYDAIIIGAGQAGGPLSTTLAKAGWKTALIEREHVGGTCVNEGCTPTKTMVASARIAYLARRGADYGVRTDSVNVDMSRVRQRKREIVQSFRSGSERRIESTEGVDLLRGEARFIAPKTIEVRLESGEVRHLSADTILLNSGARPSTLAVRGIEKVQTLNSTSIMELDDVPEHLLVSGGGYIGLEFGQMFHRFGSRVTVIQRGAHLLSREDDDVADEVANILREEGLEILLETTPFHIEQGAAGHIQLSVHTPQGERVIDGSHLLVATGRVPNSDSLNLEAAGVQVDKRGFVQVNDRLETSVAGIYAMGDIKGGPAFTHISYDDFRILRSNLLEGGSASIGGRLVPYTVFIDPQLGRVGLSETEARAQGRNIRVARMPMSYVARALEVDETRGFMKAIVDAETKEILGCAILG
ncbi:MAG: mercuric reductase, partial [Ktedonobacteraceae bacterium]|nr:mercuric reductase [Ktedonobacteraceae bacterium]